MHSVSSIKNNSLLPYLKVKGQVKVAGHIRISGAKNSALVLMAASLLTKESVYLSNVPALTDINVMGSLLQSMGVTLKNNENDLQIQALKTNVINNELPYKLVQSLRASFFCIGPLLSRFGIVKIPLPGGCRIGSRPIDEHIRGLKALGATVSINPDNVFAKIETPTKRLKGSKINLNYKSVGATETILMAAVLAEGTTIINNAAQEPEIQDLANFLQKMGAKIQGAGTPRITVKGVIQLNGCSHRVIPDRIETGTFLIASAITRCPLTLSPVIPSHIGTLISKLKECGCSITESKENTITIVPNKIIKAVNITTEPYPGFPTDLQAPFMSLMCTAEGTSRIKETVFESRMQHVGELQKMGSQIKVKKNIALITGVKELKATSIKGGDLRSSAAMVLASLSAKGTSLVFGLNHLDRGYENFEEKLSTVGVEISRKAHGENHLLKKSKNRSEPNEKFSSGAEVA